MTDAVDIITLYYDILIITCFSLWMFYAMNCYGSIEI